MCLQKWVVGFKQQLNSMIINQYPLKNSMEGLIAKMRSLALEDMKNRRESIFQKTRNLKEQECQNSSSIETVSLICNQDSEIEFKKEQYSVFDVQPNPKEEVLHYKKRENQNNDYKTRRYWRNFFRVNQRLVNIPNNLQDYYVSSYPKGTKSLLIFKRQEIQLLDQYGYIIYSHTNPVTHLAGTILQASYQKQDKKLIIVDLISWNTLSYGSLQFEYRITWLKDHTKYSITALSQGLQMDVYLVDYRACTFENLQIVYNEQPLYARDGLFFVQNKSYYDSGHNPLCLLWKNERTSATFSQEYEQNKMISKGLGYLNKNGDVKTRDNRLLFHLDPVKMRQQIRFVKFTYKGIQKVTNQEGGKQVEFASLKLVGHERSNYEGFADTLSELVYKCSLKSNLIKMEDLLSNVK